MTRTSRMRIFASIGMIVMIVMLGSLPLFFLKSEAAAKYNEIVVSLKAGVDINQINARYGTYTIERLDEGDEYLLGLPAGAKLNKLLNQMNKDSDIVFADVNNEFGFPEVSQRSHAFIDPGTQALLTAQSNSKYLNQPFVSKLGLTKAHESTRGTGVRVAVIDTGLDFDHPLFAGRIAYPVHDYVDQDGIPNDETGGAGAGHGTFVAGLILRVAPDAMIMPVRAFDKNGVGTSFAIAKAIKFAVKNGAQVINMSFGLPGKDQLIKKALNKAQLTSYLVAAAGNANTDSCEYPGSEQGRTLSVTATTNEDVKADFANYHKKISVSAPGVQLYSAFAGGNWATWSGTSFATALASGEAALLLALKPELKAQDLDRLIINSGLNIDSLNSSYKNKIGLRIDCQFSVQMLLSGK